MKTSLLLGSTLGILLLAGTASAATTTYNVTLDTAQEKPTPTVTTASGSATLTYDDVTHHLTGQVTYTGTSSPPNLCHVHEGVCGVSGPITAPNGSIGDTVAKCASGTNIDVELEADGIAALPCGGLYLNFHTDANAGGELRGQILPAGAAACTGTADPAAPACPATGGDDAGASSSGATSSSGSTDTPTTGTDAGTSSSGGTTSDSGCSTTGSTPTGSLALILGVGLALSAVARGRRNKK